MPVHLRALAMVALAACSDGDDDAVPDACQPPTGGDCDVVSQPGERWADLGTGVDFYEELDEGDDILIVFGPQGGYHLDGSVRVRGVNPGNCEDLADEDNPLTTFEVRREGGELVSGTGKPGDEGLVRYRQGLDGTCEPGVYEMAGRRIFLRATDVELAGERLTITVTVEDVDGVSVSDTLEALAVPSPFN